MLFVYFLAQNAHCKWFALKCNLYLFESTVLSLSLSFSLFRWILKKFTCNRCHRHQFIARNPISEPISLCVCLHWSFFLSIFENETFSAQTFSLFLFCIFLFLSHFICGCLIRHISCTNFTFRKFHLFSSMTHPSNVIKIRMSASNKTVFFYWKWCVIIVTQCLVIMS